MHHREPRVSCCCGLGGYNHLSPPRDVAASFVQLCHKTRVLLPSTSIRDTSQSACQISHCLNLSAAHKDVFEKQMLLCLQGSGFISSRLLLVVSSTKSPTCHRLELLFLAKPISLPTKDSAVRSILYQSKQDTSTTFPSQFPTITRRKKPSRCLCLSSPVSFPLFLTFVSNLIKMT